MTISIKSYNIYLFSSIIITKNLFNVLLYFKHKYILFVTSCVRQIVQLNLHIQLRFHQKSATTFNTIHITNPSNTNISVMFTQACQTHLTFSISLHPSPDPSTQNKHQISKSNTQQQNAEWNMSDSQIRNVRHLFSSQHPSSLPIATNKIGNWMRTMRQRNDMSPKNKMAATPTAKQKKRRCVCRRIPKKELKNTVICDS